MKSSMEKTPGWLRGVQIGLGIITVILAIYALAFPAVTFLAVIVILAIILFIVGIEKIITGIFLPVKGRWATIGFGILVIIFAGLAITFPEATALVVTVFVGIGIIIAVGLLITGIQMIAVGVAGRKMLPDSSVTT